MRKTSSTLVAIVLILLSLGIVILASTSSVKGSSDYDDPQYFLKRQLLWLAVALAVGLAVSRFDYHWWQRLAVPLAVVSVILLLLVFVPQLGPRLGGSRRWLRLGPLSLQPSEFAKFCTVIVLSGWLARVGRRVRKLREGLVYPVLVLGVVLGLVILEPDFGTTLLTGVVGMLIMFAAGVRLTYLAVIGMLGLCAFVLAVMQDPVRMERILAFVNPSAHRDAAHQLIQSTRAFVGGGPFGVGLANSIQKQFYLPEAHTDFIFAIIGEEMGFLATAAVVLLFMGLLACGMVICARAPDPFGRLLGFGFTMMITVQAALNIGVVTGCLPTKGLPLPFISYGGSSLVMSVASVAVLLNIAQHAGKAHADEHTRMIRDKAHDF